MSHIHRVGTEITRGSSLVAALERLGVPFQVSTNLERNSLPMPGFAGSTTRCAAFISREDVSRTTGTHCYNGLGFVWNGRGYDLAIDPMDAYAKEHQALTQRITQEYARAELHWQLDHNPQLAGYTAEEEELADGTIRIELHSWGG